MGKTKYKKPFVKDRENVAAFLRDVQSRKVRGLRRKTTDDDIISSQIDEMEVEMDQPIENLGAQE